MVKPLVAERVGFSPTPRPARRRLFKLGSLADRLIVPTRHMIRSRADFV
jgi:hypothetical protein